MTRKRVERTSIGLWRWRSLRKQTAMMPCYLAPTKGRFLAATIQTYMSKFAFDLSSLCYLLQLVRGVRI